MKCRIIVVNDDERAFEKRINDFIKNMDDCHVSVSSTRYFAGYNPHTEFVACITYAE